MRVRYVILHIYKRVFLRSLFVLVGIVDRTYINFSTQIVHILPTETMGGTVHVKSKFDD